MTIDRCFVIAEAGVNHNGSLDLALQLVDAAASAGADAVKFQTFRADRLVTAQAAKAAYQVHNTGDDGGQLAMLRALELGPDDHHRLIARCRERGIRFMSTAFDAESLAFLLTLDMPALKIPSGDITAAPLLLQAARARRPLIVSTGMATLGEIEAALGVIAFGLLDDGSLPPSTEAFQRAALSAPGQQALRAQVRLLHCVTEYPAPPAQVNLRAMDTMSAAFGLPVGYSDHTLGTAVALAAVARGATVIEKHLTLDRALPGPDHRASIEPGEFAAMVEAIRTIEAALGAPFKGPGAAEAANRVPARRSLVAARPIRAGQLLVADDLSAKRPGDGLSPMRLWEHVGRPAARDYAADEPFSG
jgi:N-acetylneuraminate synthase